MYNRLTAVPELSLCLLKVDHWSKFWPKMPWLHRDNGLRELLPSASKLQKHIYLRVLSKVLISWAILHRGQEEPQLEAVRTNEILPNFPAPDRYSIS